MTELKTLKELESNIFDSSQYKIMYKAVSSEKLKEEAIKWIKELRYTSDLSRYSLFDFVAEKYTTSNVVSWIKHFFNITEEDLND